MASVRDVTGTGPQGAGEPTLRAYTRLIRPFPLGRLVTAAQGLDVAVHRLTREMTGLAVNEPREPITWCQGLQRVEAAARDVEDHVASLVAMTGEMHADAERAYDVSVRAVIALMRDPKEAT